MFNLTNILRALDVSIAAFLETAWPMALPPRPNGADELAEREAEEEVSEPPLNCVCGPGPCPDGVHCSEFDDKFPYPAREEQVRAEAFGAANGEFGDSSTLGRQDLSNAAYVIGRYANGQLCPAGGAGFWLELGRKFRHVVDAMP